jgi:hypothetical protein
MKTKILNYLLILSIVLFAYSCGQQTNQPNDEPKQNEVEKIPDNEDIVITGKRIEYTDKDNILPCTEDDYVNNTCKNYPCFNNIDSLCNSIKCQDYLVDCHSISECKFDKIVKNYSAPNSFAKSFSYREISRLLDGSSCINKDYIRIDLTIYQGTTEPADIVLRRTTTPTPNNGYAVIFLRRLLSRYNANDNFTFELHRAQKRSIPGGTSGTLKETFAFRLKNGAGRVVYWGDLTDILPYSTKETPKK